MKNRFFTCKKRSRNIKTTSVRDLVSDKTELRKI